VTRSSVQQTRRMTALHESGHVVVGLVLCNDPTATAAAILESAGNGIAIQPREICAEASAAVIAAGSVAEELLLDQFCPREPEPVANTVSLPTFPPPAPPTGAGGTPEASRDVVGDAIALAQHCIADGRAAHPWKWLREHADVMNHARAEVLRHRAAILAVAENIYLEGFWTGTRNDIETLTQIAAQCRGARCCKQTRDDQKEDYDQQQNA
jgi:hypothetical protein